MKGGTRVNDNARCPRIRVAAIIVRNGHILLARHQRKGARYWVLPGGAVEYRETLEQALVRELKEEANLDITVRDLVMVSDSMPKDLRRHVVDVFFTADVAGGKLRVGVSDKRLVDMQFVAVERLSRLRLYPNLRRQLLRGIANGFAVIPCYQGKLYRTG
jgi:ADP-ribose pyrophosphatase YjhB (NUDIX family)